MQLLTIGIHIAFACRIVQKRTVLKSQAVYTKSSASEHCCQAPIRWGGVAVGRAYDVNACVNQRVDHPFLQLR